MKFNSCYYVVVFFISFSCKCQQIDTKEITDDYILLNKAFVNGVKEKITNSQVYALTKEKDSFIETKMEDVDYLQLLESLIKKPYSSFNKFFFSNDLVKVSDSLENLKAKSIYFLNIKMEGETISNHNIVIIEADDYRVHLFTFNNSMLQYKYNEKDESLIEFIHEFMLNVPYSFKNKTFFNNSVQYFTIDKIIATGANKYMIESIVIPRMLNYQIDIFKAFFNLDYNGGD